MIRVLVSLWGTLAWVAADGQAAASSLPGEPFAPPAINCEQPANTTAAPAPGSEANMYSIMRQFMMDKSITSQMEAWWRERPGLHNGIALEQSPSAMQEATAQMEAWWKLRTELGHVSATKPAPTPRHRHHRQASAPAIEYGCPPSICANH
jgi:hypothetical protein